MTPIWLTDTVTSDLERALHYTKLWGLEGVELRTVGSVEDRIPFVNEAKVRYRLGEAGMPLMAVVPGLFEGPIEDRAGRLSDLSLLEEVFQFCRRLGCPRVVVSGFRREETDPDEATEAAASVLRQAARAAERSGIHLLVLNEADGLIATGADLAALMRRIEHPLVRAAWSPAEALSAGESGDAGLEALLPWVGLVRVRDGVMGKKGWEERTVGEGAVEWPEQVRRLAEAGFEGPLSLEIRRRPAPQEGLQAATALIRMIRAVRRRV